MRCCEFWHKQARDCSCALLCSPGPCCLCHHQRFFFHCIEPVRLEKLSKITKPSPTLPTDHVPPCHTYMLLQCFLGWWLHHFSGQPYPIETHCSCDPQLNSRWGSSAPGPHQCCVSQLQNVGLDWSRIQGIGSAGSGMQRCQAEILGNSWDFLQSMRVLLLFYGIFIPGIPPPGDGQAHGASQQRPLQERELRAGEGPTQGMPAPGHVESCGQL